MKLTEEYKSFLENLRNLMDSKDLWVELKLGRPSYMVLKGAYGDKIHQTFRMARQGVRWRFHRLLNCVYGEAFETILFIEKIFGTQLRKYAIGISKERYDLRQEIVKADFMSAGQIGQRKAGEMKR